MEYEARKLRNQNRDQEIKDTRRQGGGKAVKVKTGGGQLPTPGFSELTLGGQTTKARTEQAKVVELLHHLRSVRHIYWVLRTV